jgi:hypothetical protein
MDAETVTRAAGELASLRRLARQQSAVAVAAALVAGPSVLLDPSLAFAFAVGASFEAILTFTTRLRRGTVVASLAVHREAYLLPDVRRYGTALATMKSRRSLARTIASMLRDASGSRSGVELVERVIWQAPALAALARALLEPENVVEPTAMADCAQLLTDGRASPLLNPALPRTELDRVLRRIHAGISPPPPGTSVSDADRPQAA